MNDNSKKYKFKLFAASTKMNILENLLRSFPNFSPSCMITDPMIMYRVIHYKCYPPIIAPFWDLKKSDQYKSCTTHPPILEFHICLYTGCIKKVWQMAPCKI